jgi:hypothetical protein
VVSHGFFLFSTEISWLYYPALFDCSLSVFATAACSFMYMGVRQGDYATAFVHVTSYLARFGREILLSMSSQRQDSSQLAIKRFQCRSQGEGEVRADPSLLSLD